MTNLPSPPKFQPIPDLPNFRRLDVGGGGDCGYYSVAYLLMKMFPNARDIQNKSLQEVMELLRKWTGSAFADYWRGQKPAEQKQIIKNYFELEHPRPKTIQEIQRGIEQPRGYWANAVTMMVLQRELHRRNLRIFLAYYIPGVKNRVHFFDQNPEHPRKTDEPIGCLWYDKNHYNPMASVHTNNARKRLDVRWFLTFEQFQGELGSKFRIT